MNGAVATEKLADYVVTADKMAPDAVATSTIMNGAVATDKLADGAVTAEKMAANAVATSTIMNGAVATDKLADNAVTSQKISQPIELTGTISYANTATYASTATYALSAGGGGGHYIGESYGGGIVFWVDSSGQHGLIATTTNQGLIQWYNGAYGTTNAVRDGVYAGQYNTERIIATQTVGSYAAQICANCQEGGYGDWYLPSKYELNLLYLQKDIVGGFESGGYWSSTEYNSSNAWYQNFGSGYQDYGNKANTYYVRAIRAF